MIVLTAIQEEEVARAALEAGAFDYVTKPLELGHLEKVLTAALAEDRDAR